MPTYEYRCKDCSHELEIVQSFQDAPLTECPSCGGRLRKLFGNVGITFKGSGFYKTDSRSANGGGSGAKSESGGDSGSSDAKGDATKNTDAAGESTKKDAPASTAPASKPSTSSSGSSGSD